MPKKPMAASRLRSLLRVEPGSKVRLANFDPGATHGWTKEKAQPAIAADLVRMADLQERLFAERQQRVLVILQGIDAAGKDGTITHVLSAMNPRGAPVSYFGVPTGDGARPRLPVARPRGRARARARSASSTARTTRTCSSSASTSSCPKATGRARYAQINDFERMLSEEGTTIVKFFLHIDKDEQRERLQARYDDPTKRWKFNVGDIEERSPLGRLHRRPSTRRSTRCSTRWRRGTSSRPNRKWFRNLAVGQIVARRLEELNPQYPARDDLPPGYVVP